MTSGGIFFDSHCIIIGAVSRSIADVIAMWKIRRRRHNS